MCIRRHGQLVFFSAPHRFSFIFTGRLRMEYRVVKTGPGRTTGAWQRLKAETLAWAALHRRPCYLCRRPIDYALTQVQPNHGQAATVHHIVGLEQGGAPEDPANLAVAHRGCNTRHSNRLRGLASARRKSLAQLATGSRRW